MKPQIVNIINFVRGVEPRYPELDLLEPVKNQISLLKKHGLPAAFLIQYDAMQQEKFVQLLKDEQDGSIEIGGWLEVVKPLVEKAGLAWRGRDGFPWDWHANVGFTVGYTPEEREKLVDVFMEDFKDTFGYFPSSVGSWIIDAHTLEYMSQKYGIAASCNCRDQWGTDGYTLWGGYYNQGYYPSKYNVLCPAQNMENQINVPVFRMLGSDPIYQYDAGLSCDDGAGPSEWQPVYTLEPANVEGGGTPEWVKWYFRENFNGLCLSFGYTQAGQENSFGWEAMSKGFAYQLEYISEKSAAGELRVETLGATGKWYKEQYSVTPSSSVSALSDWQDRGHKSVWYCSRFYRINLFWDENHMWIRDMHLFDEKYCERYLEDTCKDTVFTYDNLPVIDGNRWSSGKIRFGLYPYEIKPDGSRILINGKQPCVAEKDDSTIHVTWPLKNNGTFNIICESDKISVFSSVTDESFNWRLCMVFGGDVKLPVVKVKDNSIEYCYNNRHYSIHTVSGKIVQNAESGNIEFLNGNGLLVVKLNKGTNNK